MSQEVDCNVTEVIDFTVAIRVYNAGDRLPALLDRLQTQEQVTGVTWEVLVVDNNSSDDTASIVKTYQEQWRADCPLRYVFEPKQGAAIARRRAMLEARGTWVGFLDDDNLPDARWVATAYAFGQAHPQAGAMGGQIHGLFEVPPPPNFGKIACFIAVIERQPAFCYNAKDNGRKNHKVLPPGAGIVIRKQAWLDSVPQRSIIQGPTGGSIASKGEDIELLMYLRQAGWEIWNCPEMHIYHQIPQWRMERTYLIKLVRGVGLAKYSLRMLDCPWWQVPFMTIAYLMNDFRKAAMYFLRNRKTIKVDTVAACEMELLLTSLVSPFHQFKIWLSNV